MVEGHLPDVLEAVNTRKVLANQTMAVQIREI
jgi:hypothetical protein